MSRLQVPKTFKPGATSSTRKTTSKTGLKGKGAKGAKKQQTCQERQEEKVAEAEALKESLVQEAQTTKRKKEESTMADMYPAFSRPLDPKTMKETMKYEKKKKKMIRRNKPPGEDVKKLKEIVESITGQQLTVQEFIGLVSPSTGDNGDLLRSVLASELAVFRTTARKIYETMTQDVSDVLTNEHIQLTEFSQQQIDIFTNKMMRCINEIYTYIPDFKFDKYYSDPEYLNIKTKLPEEFKTDPETLQALMRQEAYHRYQWLKGEGERLKQENSKLQGQLNKLKRAQREELAQVAQREKQAEEERQMLTETQNQLEARIDELNESVEKQLVETELANVPPVQLGAKKKEKKVRELPKKKVPRLRSNWAADAAADIESAAVIDKLKTEGAKVSVKAKQSTTMMKTKREMKKRMTEMAQQAQQSPPGGCAGPAQPASPFHFSPIKTPPAAPPTRGPPSPFHFSPIKTPPTAAPPRGPPSPFHYSPPAASPPGAYGGPPSPPRMHYEHSNTVTEPDNTEGRTRPCKPKDTWGGFN